MSSGSQHPQSPVTSLWTRLRVGPTASLTHAARWQWYEVAWALLLVALFGTTGRIVEIVVAVGLVGVWLLGPAISAVLAGHLAVIALGILPSAGWALVATELLLIGPVLIECALLAPTRRSSAQATGLVLVVTAIATASVWLTTPLLQTAGLVGVAYVVGVGGVYIQSRSRDSDTNTSQDPSEPADTTPHGDAPTATDTPDNTTQK
ncbi:hypothetical protein [Halobellus salinus]|uniref:hypothetical protein n=1 Tax=Halobellus salinus TaxID=931585 RepID=UPI00166D141D|nr:hypothetical protein [Halobellus salinus]SMP12971.1 hypothetical protein SAMN06265347_104123 [Halobellus salinus]